MARIDNLKAELVRVRTKLDEAYDGTGVSLEGHSLTRQSITILKEREAELTWDIQSALKGGFLSSIVVKGRYDDVGVVRAENI